jgi:hypothetical protein
MIPKLIHQTSASKDISFEERQLLKSIGDDILRNTCVLLFHGITTLDPQSFASATQSSAPRPTTNFGRILSAIFSKTRMSTLSMNLISRR